MDQVGHNKKSAVIKRAVLVNSHKTSVSLEDEFWLGLREIAYHEHINISKLVERINHSRDTANLSSAIRVFVFNHFRRPRNENRDTQSQRQENLPLSARHERTSAIGT